MRRVQLTLRDYRDEDFDMLWAIDQACFPPGIAYSEAELAHYVRRSGAFTIIAEVHGETGGFIVAEAKRSQGHLITLDIKQEFRRKGIGSKLMFAAEARLKNSGCELSLLEAAVNNLSALAFYKRHGYVVLKTIPRYYDGKLDALLMGKRLKNAARD